MVHEFDSQLLEILLVFHYVDSLFLVVLLLLLDSLSLVVDPLKCWSR